MKKAFSLKSHPLIKGTFFLTAAGLLSRVMGFFYRIFLSRTIGAEGMGIYQLIFPVYAILNSFCAAGIQTSVSRLVAARSTKEQSSAALRCGLILSLALSLISSGLLYTYAGPAAVLLLGEARCAPLLRALAFAIPLGSIHACINGYYFGLQRAVVPSVTQLLEQGVRVFFIWMAASICMQEGRALSLEMTVWAIVAGELSSTLYSLTAFALQKSTLPSYGRSVSTLSCLGPILSLAVPLTANRLLINLLSSVEAVMIPARLQVHGHSPETALVLYGVLSGMTMPLILFPTAVTNSVSVLLLPTVAKAQSAKDDRQISSAVHATVKYCLLLGILFLGIFLLYGYELGIVLFENSLAGDFLRTLAWICPFLYLSSTLSSIINGLGKTAVTFLHNIISLLLRILFLFFLVPVFGIRAYLWGLLAALLLQTSLGFWVLWPYMAFDFPAYEWIVKPVLFLLISIGCSFFLEPLLGLIPDGFPLLALGLRIAAICGFYLSFLTLYQLLPKGALRRRSRRN